MKLTKTEIDKLSFKGKDAFYWDDSVSGFGVKVTRRGKSYIIQSRVLGKTIRKKIASCSVMTPEEARREAKKLSGEMAGGVNINAEEKKKKVLGVTLQEAYKDYKKTRTLTIKTMNEYDRAIEKTLSDWKEVPLVSISRDKIEKRFKEISKKAPALANLHFRLLRALFNFSIEKYAVDGEPIIPSNPCGRLTILKLWNRVERRKSYIRPEQLKDFLNALTHKTGDAEHLKTVKNQCFFILFTGCRDQEAASLKVKDIDQKRKAVTFWHTKNHHQHILPLGEYLFEFVKKLCTGKGAEDYLFPADNKSGHLLNQRYSVKKIAQESGVPFTLHDLRRTFASIANNHISGITNFTLKKLLNHSENDVTAGYIQFEPESLRGPMQRIEDFILEQAGIKAGEAGKEDGKEKDADK